MELLDSDAAFENALQQLASRSPRAASVWLAPDLALPLHEQRDPRVGSLAAIGIATDEHVIATAGTRARARTLSAWLERSGDTYVVFHGAQDALLRLAVATGSPVSPRTRRLGCTQTAAILLAEGTRRGRDLPTLTECTEKLLETPWQAPDQLLNNVLETTARGAALLLPLMKAMTPLLRQRELARTFALECEVVPSVVAMERAGLAVDAAAFERVASLWRSERRDTQDPDRIARLDKLISTYAYWGQEYVRDGRIHSRLHPLATDSGRFSCTDPNLQQVPSNHTAPGLRACFRPSDDRVLVVADYAQIELRVAAHLAPCDALRRVFREGRDPHRATAATITGKPEGSISDHERKLAKAVNFGFLFGMGAARFRDYAASGYGVELSEQDAAEARAAFMRTFPGIAAWHQRVGTLSRSRTPVVVRTALGRRKRFLPGRISFNAALNIPVQGTAAEGFKRAMVELQPALSELGARGVMVVHDEYIAEAPRATSQEVRDRVASVMQAAMASVVTTVPIEVEALVRDSWG